MSSLKEFFIRCLAGVVSTIILSFIFVGIKTVYLSATTNQEEKIAAVQREITELDAQISLEERRAKRLKNEQENLEKHPQKFEWRHPIKSTRKKFENWVDSKKKPIEVIASDSKLGLLMAKKTAAQTKLITLQSFSALDVAKDVFRQKFKTYLCYAFFLVFIAPVLWKIFMYCCVARYVENHKPVRAVELDEYKKSIDSTQADVSLDFDIPETERLYLRSGNWGKKRTDLEAKTKFLWSYRYPLISFVAGLVELVQLTALKGKQGRVTITSPEPDMYIGRIDLIDGCGIVIRPKYLVAVTKNINIRTKWNFNLHNIISGRIRQIILFGTGTVFITGSWGIDCQFQTMEQNSRIEDNLILGYEASAEYSLCRTETFWHYLRGTATLFDLCIRKGTFLTQNNNPKKKGKNETFFERIFGAVLNGVGSFLGF